MIHDITPIETLEPATKEGFQPTIFTDIGHRRTFHCICAAETPYRGTVLVQPGCPLHGIKARWPGTGGKAREL